MIANRLTRILVLCLIALLFLTPAITQPVSGQTEGPAPQEAASKIEPDLLERLSTESLTDFIVHFSAQADLEPAYALDWEARGEFVIGALQATADASQAAARAYLDQHGLKYTPFLAGNALYVYQGDAEAVYALADLGETSLLRITRTYALEPFTTNPLSLHTVPQPEALAWGIADTKANLFWAQFSVQGDGIVVAGIDTGVDYDHPALINAFKCTGNPNNSACWSDPSNICGQSGACDNNGHGTHTLGTMVADDNPSLQYMAGMAPNAKWIACKGCESTSCSDYGLLSCADWVLHPAGNPANRPHVVNNSWGGDGGNAWFQPEVSAWRAAGIFPAFSAGNKGAGCQTIGSPGDYQDSFATAAHMESRAIASFSSRGASYYGHDPYTKPNISAPGDSICSTYLSGSFSCGYSGTSMASPHTAGAVALLWSCNPTLVGQIDLTFQVLQNSADPAPGGNCDAPPDGQGNYTFGYGYLNVLQAGQTACTPLSVGTLQGHVRSASTNQPIAGALVSAIPEVNAASIEAVTDPTGFYSLELATGTYEVSATKYGYQLGTATGVVVNEDATTTQDFSLTYLGEWRAGPPDPGNYTRWDCVWFDDSSGLSAYNQKVYCMGGRVDASLDNGSIMKFDPLTGVWSDTGFDMYEDVSNYTANLLRDENYATNGLAIYVVGGTDTETTTYSSIVQRFYPKIGGNATQVATDPWMQAGPYLPGACVNAPDQARLVCFGGFWNTGWPFHTDTTYTYDPSRAAGSRWQALNGVKLHISRGFIQAAVLDNWIYAIGGEIFDGSDLYPMPVVERLDTNNLLGGWQTLGQMPVGLAEGRAFALDVDTEAAPGDVIYLAGGGDWPDESAEVMTYDPATNRWDQTITDLMTARRNHAGVYVPLCTSDPDDGLPGLWVFGGRTGSDSPPYAEPEYYALPCTSVPLIEVSPANLVLSLLPGVTQTKPVTIKNTGDASLTFSVSENPAATWLSASPTSGTVAPAGQTNLNVTVNTTGMAPGYYSSRLVITNNDPTRPKVSVPVILSVLDPAPVLIIDPASLQVALLPDSTASIYVKLENEGHSSLTFTITDTVGWMTTTLTSGSIMPGEISLARFDFNSAGLTPAVYSSTLQVTSNDPDRQSVDVPVLLAVDGEDTYSILGCVLDGQGAALPGVTISAGGGVVDITSASGCFAFTGLAAGEYPLTAALEGYRFTPLSRPVTLPESATLQDFMGVLFRTHAYLPLVNQIYLAP